MPARAPTPAPTPRPPPTASPERPSWPRRRPMSLVGTRRPVVPSDRSAIRRSEGGRSAGEPAPGVPAAPCSGEPASGSSRNASYALSMSASGTVAGANPFNAWYTLPSSAAVSRTTGGVNAFNPRTPCHRLLLSPARSPSGRRGRRALRTGPSRPTGPRTTGFPGNPRQPIRQRPTRPEGETAQPQEPHAGHSQAPPPRRPAHAAVQQPLSKDPSAEDDERPDQPDGGATGRACGRVGRPGQHTGPPPIIGTAHPPFPTR
jgi:hypothetical protein